MFEKSLCKTLKERNECSKDLLSKKQYFNARLTFNDYQREQNENFASKLTDDLKFMTNVGQLGISSSELKSDQVSKMSVKERSSMGQLMQDNDHKNDVEEIKPRWINQLSSGKILTCNNFVLLHLGSFSFFMVQETINSKQTSRMNTKLCKKLKECISIGLRSRLNNERNFDSKSFVLVEINLDEVCMWNKRKRMIHQHQLVDVQFWNYEEASGSCFVLVVNSDSSRKHLVTGERNVEGKMLFICHVFMLDASVSKHLCHRHIANMFDMNCHSDIKSEKCFEFPTNFNDIITNLKSQMNFVSELSIGFKIYSPSSTIQRGSLNISSHINKEFEPHKYIDGSAEEDSVSKKEIFQHVESFVNVLNQTSRASFANFNKRDVVNLPQNESKTQSSKPPLPSKLLKNRPTFNTMKILKDLELSEKSTPSLLHTVSEEDERLIEEQKEERKKIKKCFYESDSGLDGVKSCRRREKMNDDMEEGMKRKVARKKSSNCESFVNSNKEKTTSPITNIIPQNNFIRSLSRESISVTSSSSSLTQCDPTNKRCASPRVTGWTVSFERLLSDPVGLALFTEFLKKEFCLENMKFWRRCENYKHMSEGQRKREAQKIYMDHFSPGAVDPINVDHEISTRVWRELMDAPTELFDAAQRHIYLLMKQDIYPRFKRSDLFKSILQSDAVPSFIDQSYDYFETKRGRSLLFWHKRKLPKTFTSPDIRGTSHYFVRVDKSSALDEKLRFNFPDGRSLLVSIKNHRALQLTIREVLLPYRNKIKFGINFYEPVDSMTGRVLNIDDQLCSLQCSKLEMTRRSLFQMNVFHKKIIIRSKMGVQIGECLEPILRKFGLGIETVVLESISQGCKLDLNTTVNFIDCQHIVAHHKYDLPAISPLRFFSPQLTRILPSFTSSCLIDYVVFDEFGIADIDKPRYVECGRGLQSPECHNKSKLFNFIKRNASQRRKPFEDSTCRMDSELIDVQVMEPTFDDDLLDLIQHSQCRTIDTQRHGALHKSMPSFLMDVELH